MDQIKQTLKEIALVELVMAQALEKKSQLFKRLGQEITEFETKLENKNGE